jgi:predicted alpha/beta-hydrolase family hydrolase
MSVEPLVVDGPTGPLSADLTRPARIRAALVLAHGAGAGYRHATMMALSEALAEVDVATLRFNFPFTEAGRRRVDAPAVAMEAIVAAAGLLAARCAGVELCVGGHSFGGRMASHALADGLVDARALICTSFPLHPANRPGIERAAHLARVDVPMLFVSGTRDALAERDLLTGVVDGLGDRATLHWLEDADHGYRARKRVRRDPRPVFRELAEAVAAFLDRIG